MLFADWDELNLDWSVVDGTTGSIVPDTYNGEDLTYDDVKDFIESHLPNPTNGTFVVYAESGAGYIGALYTAGMWDGVREDNFYSIITSAVEYGFETYVVGGVSDLFSVTVQYTTGGTATATPSDNLRENDSVSIAATPGAGFEFVRWEYNNQDISLSDSTKASHSFTMPAKSVSLKAIFMPKSKLSTDYMMLMQAPSTVTMTIGAGGNMTMDNYAGWVKLGGVNITDKVNVAVKDGALVVTMKKAYLDTLELGKYQLSVGLNGFDASYLSEMFTVGKVPKTADESHVALWLSVLAMAAGTVTVMELRKRKSH